MSPLKHTIQNIFEDHPKTRTRITELPISDTTIIICVQFRVDIRISMHFGKLLFVYSSLVQLCCVDRKMRNVGVEGK